MFRYLLLLTLVFASAELRADVPAQLLDEFFETKIRPVLADHCLKCHGADKQSGGLRLDGKEAILKGGDGGPALVAGKPGESRMLAALTHTGDLKMPPKQKLSDDQIGALNEWVKQGAYWPAKSPMAAVTAKKHWAFESVREPAVPTSTHKNPVDAFVEAKLRGSGLPPNPPADAATLIRRLTMDLHGLPATAAEVEVFVEAAKRDRASAIEKLIERLLASPRYGERWGRHWLDVARYSDTIGYFFEGERRYPFAYTYRDYVIKAFNDDKPYDQFLIEQIAADRLPGRDTSKLAALGFLTVGRRFLNNIHDIIDDRIDVVARGTQGLTVSCARCHDHKYDPIPAKDYYSLYGIFENSEEPGELPLIAGANRNRNSAAYEQDLAKLQGEIDAFMKKKQEQLTLVMRVGAVLPFDSIPSIAALAPLAAPAPQLNREQLTRKLGGAEREALKKLNRRIDEHRNFSPDAPPRAMVVRDRAKPTPTRMLLRGNPANPGPEVPRQFLEVTSGANRRPFAEGSGRLELARAIADPANPLTARVLVNRVWMHHFGKGLVSTPSDFGLRSDPPSHPELLDWLATQFVHGGWSIKNLHRLMLTSETYQQSSIDRSEALAQDPENRLLWKYSRRKLEIEALRDSMLSAAGALDFKEGGPAVELTREPFSHRRMVYGFIERQNLPGLYRYFDFANPDMHSPQRFNTLVPQQALYLLNSAFVTHVAELLVNRKDVARALTIEERIDAIYRVMFGRGAQAPEIELGRSFLEGGEDQKSLLSRYVQALLMSNEFAFVE